VDTPPTNPPITPPMKAPKIGTGIRAYPSIAPPMLDPKLALVPINNLLNYLNLLPLLEVLFL
jgi:hypothetical protein